MNGVQAIQASLTSTQFLCNAYIEDLADADLLVRPVPGANHVAWQIGHLIASEVLLIKEQLPQAVYPVLPDGFMEVHAQPNANKDGPDGFRSKGEYVKLFNEVRKATVTAVGQLQDSDLDRPSQGKMAPYAPRLGDMFFLVANHTLMHGGQFSVVRRKLGKPVLF